MAYPNPASAFPPDNLPFFMRHFWVAFILFGLINTRVAWRAIQDRMEKNPGLEAGYRRLFLGYALVTNVPWFLMGLGIFLGGAGSMFDYLAPWQGKPAVLAWWGAMAFLAAIGTAWVFAGGAETLARYPGLPMVGMADASKIRRFWLIGLVWNLFMAFLFFRGFPFNRGAAWGNLNPETIFPAVFPFLFVGMWLAVGWILSQVGGWAALAANYRTDQPFEGKKLRGRSCRMGGMTAYNGVLTLGADHEGLYLAMMFLFRMGHPPLFIPWGDIKATEKKGFFTTWVSLEFAKNPMLMMRLRKKDVLKLKEPADSHSVFPDIT